MFPSREDVAAHRRAVARIKNAQLVRQRRIEEIRTPAQLNEFIIEEARAHYRKGQRVISVAFSVPVLNFIDWAVETKVIAEQDTEVYIKQLLRKPLMKHARAALRQELTLPPTTQGIISKFECAYGTDLTFSFDVKISIVGNR